MATHARVARGSALLTLLVLLTLAGGARAGDEAAGRPDEAVLEAAGRHAVLVSFQFHRDAVREESGATPPDARGMAERYRFWRLSWVVPGIVAGDARTVFIADPWLSPTSIASVEVIESNGRRTPARLHGLLPHVEGAVVKTEADLHAVPAAFDADTQAPLPERLFATSVAEGAAGPEVWAEPLDTTWRRPWAIRRGRGFGRPKATFDGIAARAEEGERHVDLVVDAEGRPWGFRFGEALDANGRWRGAAVLAQDVVPYAALVGMAERAATGDAIHRLSVTFRTTSRHDRRRNPFGAGSRGTSEQDVWGLAVTRDLLLVPSDLEDEQVRRIVSIRLPDLDRGADVDAQPRPAYAGRVRGYRAFLVRVEGADFEPAAEAGAAPARGDLLVVHRVARRGGARRDSMDANRVVGRSRAYGDRRFLATERAIESGTFLRNAEGAPVGFTAVLDPADRDYQVGARRTGARSPFPPVAVLPAELGGVAALIANPDTQVMPQEEVASNRRPWLGVEGDDVDEGIADLLGVSLPTRDGRRGLIVARVYAGSPAARAGLAEGDVLLSARRLTAPGGPETDLRGGSGRPFMPSFFPQAGAPAPWRSRDNAITRLLDQWGLETEYELLWLRDKTPQRSKVRVELAPPDFSSAPRYFDDAVGLEVRDLTYEVRDALRLPEGASGVVVARVEPGTSAAQARLETNEILLEMDGEAIADAAAFETRLKEARASEPRTVRLAVRRLGRTRLVDLQLGSAIEAADTGDPK